MRYMIQVFNAIGVQVWYTETNSYPTQKEVDGWTEAKDWSVKITRLTEVYHDPY